MRVVIGLPMYAGAGGYTLRSLLSLQAAFLARGDEVFFDIESGGSIITKVRNRLVKRFMDSNNDVLVFIDADMVFDAADILKLIDGGKDVAALSYTIRKPGGRFNTERELNEQGVTPVYSINGDLWCKAERTGTGIMAITRHAFGRMALHHAGTEYTDDNGQQVLGLFDFAIMDGKYYGEDYLFCKRWRDIGGEIWILTDATVGHVGEYVYSGNYCAALGGLQQ